MDLKVFRVPPVPSAVSMADCNEVTFILYLRKFIITIQCIIGNIDYHFLYLTGNTDILIPYIALLATVTANCETAICRQHK